MKRVLILANCASGLYDFRNELLLKLLEDHEVHISLPDEKEIPQLLEEGCVVHHTGLERRGMNPLKDGRLLLSYHRLIKEIKPSVVLTYTIKPNIYGSICCRLLRIPYLVNITGLGSVFESGGLLRKLVVFLYRFALKKAECVFFQNTRNREIFSELGIKGKKDRLVPGSGVNLNRHQMEEYPSKEEPIRFLFVGRIMKEKGIDELLYAAEELKKEYPGVLFEIVGSYEEDYQELLEEKEKKGIVRLTGYQKEIHPYYKAAAAVVVPSYHEGMSNVVLEGAATGRVVLASLIPGCMEGIEEKVTGFGFAPRDKDALLLALRRFMKLSYEERVEMGKNARKKIEREFDRSIVVDAYTEEIQKLLKER